jgi:hypothetical protein
MKISVWILIIVWTFNLTFVPFSWIILIWTFLLLGVFSLIQESQMRELFWLKRNKEEYYVANIFVNLWSYNNFLTEC